MSSEYPQRRSLASKRLARDVLRQYLLIDYQPPRKSVKKTRSRRLFERQADPLFVFSPIDIKRLSFDVGERESSPVPTVITVVPIISEDETMAGRYLERAEVVADRIVIVIVVVLGEHLGIVMDLIGFLERLSIDENLFVLNLDRFALERHDALDKNF